VVIGQARAARGAPDLAGIPVFFETWPPAATFFDTAADAAAKDAFVQARTLPGCCNLHAARTTFTLEGANFREDLPAADCGSRNRDRAMAAAISWALFGDPFSSLAQTCAFANDTGGRVFIAQSTGALYRAFAAHLEPHRLVCSEYFGPQCAPGTMVGGTRHEDLQRLSFADESLDLVVTADVMEHVPDAPAAEREIARVLRRGGVYTFSIPFYFNLEHDRVRAVLRGDGTVEHFEEPQYHGDPVRPAEGILVYRDFAESDMRARFAAVGCTFEILRVWSRTLGIIGADMVTMVVRRL
jgi:SAM-dependent methyltransferase